MGNESIRVLHIDTEKGWRGGQQQVAYLFEAMYSYGFFTMLICQPDSDIQKYCHEKKLPCHPVRMYNELDLIAGFKIARYCRKNDFNIVHLHSAHALAIGLWTKNFYSKIKLIAARRVDFHIRNNIFSQFKYKSRKLDKIVCISNGIENILRADGIPGQKLITIHSGVNINKFAGVTPPGNFRHELGIPPKNVVVGTIAAMADHKDYPNLLKAAKIVIEQIDNVTFCAVGDGPKKRQILKLAHELDLNDRFIFTGFRSDIGNFLKTFDVFVLASKKEGMGTSILDAQAVGLPVIACETGGIPEIIEHGINGWLVPPRDEKSLANAISLVVENVQLRKRLGNNTLESVKKFDIHETVKKNIKLYKDLILK